MTQEKEKSQSINLKRTVVIQAIVTEKFKKQMIFELEESHRYSESRMAQIETQAKAEIDSFDAKKDADQIATINQQVKNERANYNATMRDIETKKKSAQTVGIGSLYNQGNVDGFVNVKRGDNLYEKLGGLIITVKDGVVIDILQNKLNFKE